jgi:hypothetical protein
MEVFAVDVTVDPKRSRPRSAPYQARGVFTTTPYDVQTLEGVVSDLKTTLGIRLEEFDGPEPYPQDEIQIGAELFYVLDIDKDGQGGAVLTLRNVSVGSA